MMAPNTGTVFARVHNTGNELPTPAPFIFFF